MGRNFTTQRQMQRISPRHCCVERERAQNMSNGMPEKPEEHPDRSLSGTRPQYEGQNCVPVQSYKLYCSTENPYIYSPLTYT